MFACLLEMVAVTVHSHVIKAWAGISHSQFCVEGDAAAALYVASSSCHPYSTINDIFLCLSDGREDILVDAHTHGALYVTILYPAPVGFAELYVGLMIYGRSDGIAHFCLARVCVIFALCVFGVAAHACHKTQPDVRGGHTDAACSACFCHREAVGGWIHSMACCCVMGGLCRTSGMNRGMTTM